MTLELHRLTGCPNAWMAPNPKDENQAYYNQYERKERRDHRAVSPDPAGANRVRRQPIFCSLTARRAAVYCQSLQNPAPLFVQLV